MKLLLKSKNYSAYTLLELLVVMSIMMILSGIGFSSFNGLQNTVKMNEYVATFEQTIINVQRAAMLLEREVDEEWLYGLGIYIGDAVGDNSSGDYVTFKWCSPYSDYGDATTKSEIPSYKSTGGLLCSSIGSAGIRNGCLPLRQSIKDMSSTSCKNSLAELVYLRGYESSLTTPKSKYTVYAMDSSGNLSESSISYIVFESVSGRAFFYDKSGKIVNYDDKANIDSNPVNLVIEIAPNTTSAATRKITITNLSGKITSETVVK